MAAQDYTSFTLVNPNGLVGTVGTSSVPFNGQTNDNAATYLIKSIASVSGDYTASFTFDAVSAGAYRGLYLFGLSATNDSLADPSSGVFSHYVELYWNGSSLQFTLKENNNGVISGTDGADAEVASSYTLPGTFNFLVTKSGTNLRLEISSTDAGGFSADVSLTVGAQPTFSYIYGFASKLFSSTTNEWEGEVSALDFSPAASGPSLDTVPSTAYPGQSRTVSGSGFGATQGTGGLTIGGVSQTITSWSDTSITFTTVLGANSYGTGKVVELTTGAGGTDTGAIELVADTVGGFGVVTMATPNTTDESSVAFGATPTVVTGDQFEWEDFNTLGNLGIDSEGFVSSVDTEGTFRGRFWDDTDSTWGAVGNFTAEVPGTPGPGPTPGGSGIRFLMKGNIKSTIKTTMKG